MSCRIVIVPPNSQLLEDTSTEILHTYANGEVLIRTQASADPQAIAETPVSQGLQLEGVSQETLDAARQPMDAEVGRSQVYSETNRSDEAAISAYIELIGVVDPVWLTTLNDLGIELLQYQPRHTYLSRGTVTAFEVVRQQPFVLHVTPLTDTMKPKTQVPETGGQAVWIVVQGDEATADSLIWELNQISGVEIDPQQDIDATHFYLRLRAAVTTEGQDALLERTGVLAVEPFQAPQLEDESAGLIIAGQYNTVGQPSGSYLQWLEDYGLDGAGVTIGIVDAGVDTSNEAFRDRIIDATEGRKSWHGTFVTGHAIGCYLQEKDSHDLIYGLGIAPAAQAIVQDNQRTPATLCRETVTTAAPSGITGLVQNNSWGSGTREVMDYGSQEAAYDRLVRNAAPDGATPRPLTICFSSGNSGAAGLTRPKAAKNIIVTGNSENYRPDVGKDQSDNIREVYSGPRASSHGNCGDGRIRPDIVAPGEWTAAANYDSRPGQKEYISSQNTWGGGSSAASPKTAGACALLIQWWRQHNRGKNPSPALLRSLIVNGAEPIASGGPIPNKIQGWGRLNLANIVTPTAQRIYVDQTLILKQRGDQQTWQIRVYDPQKPLKITLAWTDPPGSIGSGTATAPAIVNKLALRLTVNGKLYRGNEFQNGWSVAQGSSEREGWDNLQNIYLPAGAVSGVLQVSVTALEITTNCFNGQIANPQQDFALVITNAQLDKTGTPAIIYVGADSRAKDAPKPNKPTDHWTDKPGSNDATLLKTDWWGRVDQAAGKTTNQPTTGSKPAQTAVDSWWLQDDTTWSKPETEQDNRLSQAKGLVQSLAAGIGAIAWGTGHQVVLATAVTAESTGGSKGGSIPRITNTAPEQTYLHSLNVVTIPLSQTLETLVTAWENANPTIQRGAVILLGAGTRVSLEDLDNLRYLSFQGQIYLVSEDATILAFLAQRIHRQVGVHFRLAETSQQLPALLQETLAEASGAQRVEVAQPEPFAWNFQVVKDDRHLTLQLQFPPQETLPPLTLTRPNQPAIDLDPAQPPPGIQITQTPGILQLDIRADCQSWSGKWQLSAQSERLRLRAWVWSDLSIRLRQQPLPTPEADRGETEILLAMDGIDGVTFNRLQAQPRLINETGIGEESDRSLDVFVEASRMDIPGTPATTPTISTLISVPNPTMTAAQVIDLPLRITGKDGEGNPFTRLLRHNLIQLQPRSTWRQHLSEEPVLLLQAERLEINYFNNEISELRLHRGDRQRTLTIPSPELRQQLTWIEQQHRKLQARISQLSFAIKGQELLAIVQVL